jgi:hypothetical protein
MFGAFRPTNVLSGGLLWYVPSFNTSIENRRLVLTELVEQEDPVETLQIPESATTQAVTGC